MSRFLAFSDLHAHPFPYGASFEVAPGFTGLHNSRLIDTIKALEEVSNYAVANDIKYIVFGGDLFHTRQSVKTSAHSMVSKVIKEKFIDRNLELVMIPGNHDYADRVGHVHSMQTFEHMNKSVHVRDAVGLLNTPDLSVVSVPYTDDLEKAKRDLRRASELGKCARGDVKLLLAHLGVQGGKVGSDYVLVSDGDIKSVDIPFDDFDICLFGHYHQHQAIAKNAWFIGALTQHNWSDVGGKRGFLDITYTSRNSSDNRGSGNSVNRIETKAPKFIECYTLEDLKAVKAGDFVKYYTDKNLTPEQQAEIREKSKSTKLEIKPVKKEKEQSMDLAIENLDPTAAFEPWVDENKGDLDKERLLTLGKDLYGKAQGTNL